MTRLRTSMSDAELAARVLAGDDQAFAERARRYREMIGFVTRDPALGQDVDDERQEALLALLEASRIFNPVRGSFGAIATVRVRSRVWNARRRARSGNSRILTEALRLEHRAVEVDDSDATLADTIPDRGGSDPARVIELREELRERMLRRRAERNAKQRARYAALRGFDPCEERRRRDARIACALALVAEGKTQHEAAIAVGVNPSTVSRWRRDAA
jgi:RNA polymerase sigma factor (sigma-70 family)